MWSEKGIAGNSTVAVMCHIKINRAVIIRGRHTNSLSKQELFGHKANKKKYFFVE
jgi:hypothetical protein